MYNLLIYLLSRQSIPVLFNPLPVQFKALLHGQKGCVFFSGHYIYVLHQKQVSPPGKKS